MAGMISTLRRRALRPWVVVPLVVVVGGGIWFVARAGADETTSTPIERTVEATSGPIDQVVTASGTVEAAGTEQLGFTAAGTVTAVNVAAGDAVTAGQVLATMDSPELEAAVTQAEASVADAEAKLDSDGDAGASDAQIAADQSGLDAAQRQLDAAEEAAAGTQLVAGVTGTVTQVDLAVGDELGSGGTSGTDLTGSGTGSGQSSGDLGSGAQGGPGGASDSSGTGDDSTTASAQIEVVTVGSYTVQLGIDATEVGLVAAGQEATVRPSSASSSAFPGGGAFPGSGELSGAGNGGGRVDQGDDGGNADDSADSAGAGTGAPATTGAEATGSVTSVGAIADASSGVASFPVVVGFQSTSAELAVGSTVEVEIVYERIDDAVQVPVQAVSRDGGAATVVVRSDGGDETRTVETGVTSGGMVQITSGLDAGEQVVITIATIPSGGDGSDGGDGGGDGNGGFTPPPGFTPGEGFPGGGGTGG
jgi:multidrug efflux pump subunit AcrA (membrane-fusion protein)